MERQISIVEYFYDEDGEESKGSRCGYCKSSGTSISQGMWGHQVSCQDYQDLIDRGWRRSGKYLYKANMKKTCCPLYTIRCDAMEFKPSKSHKKLMKKVAKFLNDTPTGTTEQTQETRKEKHTPESLQVTKEVEKEKSQLQTENKSVGADPNKPKCRKAKEIRSERKRQKLAAKGIEMSEQPKQTKEQEGKTLEELIAAQLPTDQSTRKLEVKLVKVDMNDDEFRTTLKESHRVFRKYQMNIHHDEPSDCGFEKYKRFLVDSPLVFEKNSSAPTTGWGSFHEQFFLDGKLIAVGVLDILPYCISSVYFYYDTDYSFLSLGVYSALRELHLTKELNKSSSDLKYYYSGFYVHSCPKMNYKGQYSPSYLACPETYSWIPIEKCTPKLDVEKYSRLDETDKEDAVVDINTARVLVSQAGFMSYVTYKSRFKSKNDEDEVKQYAQLVGPLVAPRMALYRH